jgi:hypothetical protein
MIQIKSPALKYKPPSNRNDIETILENKVNNTDLKSIILELGLTK